MSILRSVFIVLLLWGFRAFKERDRGFRLGAGFLFLDFAIALYFALNPSQGNEATRFVPLAGVYGLYVLGGVLYWLVCLSEFSKGPPLKRR